MNKLLIKIVLLMMMPLPLQAVIYKYQDAEGRIYFSDEPVKGNYRLLQRYAIKGGVKPLPRNSGRINLGATEQNRKRYSPLIDSVAKETLLRPELLHAVIKAESAYDPKAISRKGAVGLMQLMPATAERYGVTDRYNPEQNLRGGAGYLRDLLEMFDYNLKLAIAAYNAGENAVLRNGNKVPDYPETQQYVEKVLRFYRENRTNNS
jgi:soluble lytic murein transglycosylase-like protein